MTAVQRRIHCFVRGRVQGVWYRASAQREARALGLRAWVRNLEDGGVELVAEGPSAAVEQLLPWLHEGPPRAHVTAVEVADEPPTRGRGAFEILY